LIIEAFLIELKLPRNNHRLFKSAIIVFRIFFKIENKKARFHLSRLLDFKEKVKY
tara:strand:- start:321 stop:485 length:165 start_codon:yes stop_codon:yes gene_type:complete